MLRKEESACSWPGKLTDGEGDEPLPLLVFFFRKTFHRKASLLAQLLEMCCRQLRLGLLETQGRVLLEFAFAWVLVRAVMLHDCKMGGLSCLPSIGWLVFSLLA